MLDVPQPRLLGTPAPPEAGRPQLDSLPWLGGTHGLGHRPREQCDHTPFVSADCVPWRPRAAGGGDGGGGTWGSGHC